MSVTNSRGSKVLYQVVGAPSEPVPGQDLRVFAVGLALMGRRPADMVDVETPAGVVKLTINKVA